MLNDAVRNPQHPMFLRTNAEWETFYEKLEETLSHTIVEVPGQPETSWLDAVGGPAILLGVR